MIFLRPAGHEREKCPCGVSGNRFSSQFRGSRGSGTVLQWVLEDNASNEVFLAVGIEHLMYREFIDLWHSYTLSNSARSQSMSASASEGLTYCRDEGTKTSSLDSSISAASRPGLCVRQLLVEPAELGPGNEGFGCCGPAKGAQKDSADLVSMDVECWSAELRRIFTAAGFLYGRHIHTLTPASLASSSRLQVKKVYLL